MSYGENSGGVGGSGASGRWAYWNSGNSLSSSSKLLVDSTNFILGVGTTTPNQAGYTNGIFSIAGDTAGSDDGGGAFEVLRNQLAGTPDGSLIGTYLFSIADNTAGSREAVRLKARQSGTTANNAGADFMIDVKGDNGSILERLRIKGSSGNVGLGTNDPQARLHIKSNSSELFRLETGTSFPVFQLFKNAIANDLGRIQFKSTTSNRGGILSFFTKTADNNQASASTERGYINDFGTFALGSSHVPGSTERSILIGDTNTVSGGNELGSIGSNNVNGYYWTFTAGYGNSALWQSSIAMGQSCYVGTGCGSSVALGQSCSITSGSSGAVALGNEAELSNAAIFSIGKETNASNTGSGAMGSSVEVSGQYSFAYNHGGTSVTQTENYLHGIYHAEHLVKKHDAYPGTGKRDTTAAISTSDATSTNLFTQTLDDDTTYRYDIDITARRTDTGAEDGIYQRVFKVRRQGGGAAVLGVVALPIADDETGLTVTIGVVVSGNDLQVNVIGEPGKTIVYTMNAKYSKISGA